MFEIVARINTVDGIITPCVREDFGRYRKFINTCECEICHQHRVRNDLVVIRSEDGTEKVAGTGCLRRLFGKEAVRSAEQAAEERVAYMREYYLNVKEYVNKAEDLHILRGFISKSQERMGEGVVSNASLLETWEEEPKAKVFENIKEYFLGLTPNTDFIANAQSILEKSYMSDKAVHFIPAIVNAYHRHLEDELLKKKMSENTKHYGTIGERFKGEMVVTFLAKSEYNGNGFTYFDSGIRNVFYFLTENGEVLSWKTDNEISAELGQTLILKSFTVKGHFVSKKYGNVTNILRVKVA